jgi:DNA-binding winged helix-turn-helix (wHTH) protein/TolB-like protein
VEFVVDSGELRSIDPASGDTSVRRLPRQPAKLLTLLVEKRGSVVTRDEIREHIWNDAAVEFDSGLHFCIHQIRTALGDSAGEPLFVETLPRRGYRLIPEVERNPRRRGLAMLVPVALLVVATVGLSLVLLERSAPATAVAPTPLRIGVMPFRPPVDWRLSEVPEIAEWILEELTTVGDSRVEIIGPTTTTAYDRADSRLESLGEDYDLAYVVNGRFLRDGTEPAMLAELIRISDGAHIWVERYTRFEDGRQVGREISRYVIDELGLADPDAEPSNGATAPRPAPVSGR